MKANQIDNKLEFDSTNEELIFYKTVLDSLPAFIGIQQMDDLHDPSTNHNVWANQNILEFLEYERAEIEEMGFEFFLKTMHPDDLAIIGNALEKLDSGSDNLYAGVYRLKPKNQEYKWVIGAIKVLEKKNGNPWRFLNVTLNIDQLKDTREQIIALSKENLQLKNQMKISTLTNREKQIIKLIANGRTDKEIGNTLFISQATAKTHRNNVLRKLGLRNAASLAHFADENGLD
jgi:DNA-binding CsgD family transcriptional regulator